MFCFFCSSSFADSVLKFKFCRKTCKQGLAGWRSVAEINQASLQISVEEQISKYKPGSLNSRCSFNRERAYKNEPNQVFREKVILLLSDSNSHDLQSVWPREVQFPPSGNIIYRLQVCGPSNNKNLEIIYIYIYYIIYILSKNLITTFFPKHLK